MTKEHARKAMAVMSVAGVALWCGAARAQVPVIDNATLTQATQTASNTAQIMNSNQQILQTVNQTLQAVTGNRQTGSIASSALGSGFSMSGAPSFSTILGGQMSWGSMGQFSQVAAGFINGLNLVKTLTNASGAASTAPIDQAYLGAANTAAAIAGLVSGQQSAATSRTSAFQSAGGQIGSAPDIKGSIDQNSQLQVQTGLTINELIGTMNGVNATLNAQQLMDLTAASETAKIMQYDASKARLVQ
ncbi:Type IV secretion system protein [Rhizobiales bacterium GAS113]|nr:Type IV secretion system protein [Rhizobiales bacterium GAS113]